jgi:hypothetical protein
MFLSNNTVDSSNQNTPQESMHGLGEVLRKQISQNLNKSADEFVEDVRGMDAYTDAIVFLSKFASKDEDISLASLDLTPNYSNSVIIRSKDGMPIEFRMSDIEAFCKIALNSTLISFSVNDSGNLELCLNFAAYKPKD